MLAGSVYKKFKKEQENEVGAWYDKSKRKYHEEAYLFTEKVYKKLLSRCPLYMSLQNSHKIIQNPFQEFITLDSSWDGLGRAMRLKNSLKLDDSSYLGINFPYLKDYIFKKFLILSLIPHESADYSPRTFLYKDLDRQIIKKLFMLSLRKISAPSNKLSEDMGEIRLSSTKLPSIMESDLEQSFSSTPEVIQNQSQWGEYIPKSKIFLII